MLDDQMPTPQELIAAGQLEQAARLLEQQGELARAAELYEQLWDFSSAARACRAGGDWPRTVRNLLQVKDQGAVERLLQEVEQADSAVIRGCAAACEERGAWALAARLHTAAGDLDAAATSHERAGDLLAAARALESGGHLRRAMELYRATHDDLLSTDAPERQVAPVDLSLGRLLLRYGQQDEALPLLQRAARVHPDPGQARAAGRAAVVALHRLGYLEAARFAARLLPADADGQHVTLQRCLDEPALAPVSHDDEKILAGRYRLGELIGSGGMGRVYDAIDRLTEARVAVKVFTAPGGPKGRDAYRRFVREARTTGQLRHPNIVSLLDFNEEMGFMVLEHMAGGSLADRVQGGMALGPCRTVLLQVLAGLAAAHQRGIVHRDIKPSNVFFSTAGAAKLGDFGVAHLQDAGQTQTGAFIGTLAFMSPEQIKGDPISFATDIYALGVTLFQMLTGAFPFTPPDLVTKHLTADPPAPSERLASIPPAWDQVVLRCLAKEPQQRYESLESLCVEVERLPVGDDRWPTGPAPQAGSTAETTPGTKESNGARAGDDRLVVERSVLEHPALQLLQARDSRLGREVWLARVAHGPRRAPLLELLAVAARAGSANLQRVLSLNHDSAEATLETSDAPAPKLPPADAQERLRWAAQIGRALAPLHATGLTHGALAADQLWQQEHSVRVSLLAALQARCVEGPAITPQQEVRAVFELLGLTVTEDVQDGADLSRWAEMQAEALSSQQLQQRRATLRQQQIDDAPAEVARALGQQDGPRGR